MPPLTLPLIMRLRTQSRDAVSGNLELEDFGNILLESGDAAVKLEPGDSIYSMPKWGGRYLSSRNNPSYSTGEIYFVDGQMYVQTVAPSSFNIFTARRLALQNNGSFVGAIYTQDNSTDSANIDAYTTKTVSDSQYVYGIHTRFYSTSTTNSSFLRRYFKTLFSLNVPTGFALAPTVQSIRFNNQAIYDAVVVADDTILVCGMHSSGGNYRQYLGITELNQLGVITTNFNVLLGDSSSTVYNYSYRSLAYDSASSSVFYGGGVIAGAEFGRATVSGTTLSHIWRRRFSGVGTSKVVFADGFLYVLTSFFTGSGLSAIFQIDKLTIDGGVIWRKAINPTVSATFDQFFSDATMWGVTYHPMGRLIVWNRAFFGGNPGAYVASFTLDGNLVWERGVFYPPSAFNGAQAVEVSPVDGAILILMGDGQFVHVVRMSYDGTPLRSPGPSNFYITSVAASHAAGGTPFNSASSVSNTTFTAFPSSNALIVNSDNGFGSYSLTTF